jgi:hypothetical protein
MQRNKVYVVSNKMALFQKQPHATSCLSSWLYLEGARMKTFPFLFIVHIISIFVSQNIKLLHISEFKDLSLQTVIFLAAYLPYYSIGFFKSMYAIIAKWYEIFLDCFLFVLQTLLH